MRVQKQQNQEDEQKARQDQEVKIGRTARGGDEEGVRFLAPWMIVSAKRNRGEAGLESARS